MTILIKHSNDVMSYRVYVDGIGTADVVTATFQSQDLVFGTATPDNTTTPKSVVVQISGGSHAKLYAAVGTFTLSGGGTLVRSIPIRMFN
jgi:hypothetical protein